MTNAGFGALTVTLRAITEPGDEVLYLSPPWFFYELLIAAADAVPLALKLEPPAFDPDVDAIAGAIRRERGDHREQPAQPVRAGLPAGVAEPARARARGRLAAQRADGASSVRTSRIAGSCSTNSLPQRRSRSTQERS